MTVTHDRSTGRGPDPTGDAARRAAAHTSGANALAMDPTGEWEPVAPRRPGPSDRAVGPNRGTVLVGRTPGRAGLPERPAPSDASPAGRTTTIDRALTDDRPARDGRSTRDAVGEGRSTRDTTRARLSTEDERPTRRVKQAPAERRVSVPRPRRRTPWVSDVTEELDSRAASEPQPAPLPVAWPRAPFLMLVVGIVVIGVVGVLVLNTKINEGSFRLGDLRASQAALDLQEQQLNQQLADLESPGNLRAAATRLGLVPAGTPAFISLPDGRVVGIPQPASGR
jgi:hypothetical protein